MIVGVVLSIFAILIATLITYASKKVYKKYAHGAKDENFVYPSLRFRILMYPLLKFNAIIPPYRNRKVPNMKAELTDLEVSIEAQKDLILIKLKDIITLLINDPNYNSILINDRNNRALFVFHIDIEKKAMDLQKDVYRLYSLFALFDFLYCWVYKKFFKKGCLGRHLREYNNNGFIKQEDCFILIDNKFKSLFDYTPNLRSLYNNYSIISFGHVPDDGTIDTATNVIKTDNYLSSVVIP